MPYSRRQIDALNRSPLLDAEDIADGPTRIAEIVIRRQVFAVENEAVNALLRRYMLAFEDMRRFAEAGSAPTTAWRDNLLQKIVQRVATLTDEVAAISLRAATAAYRGAYYGKAWQLSEMTREGTRIRADAPDALAALLAEDVYTDIIQSLMGAEWRLQFADELDLLTAQIRLSISQGMSAGEGIDSIMRRVRGVMGIETDRRKGYRANFNRVQTITRTVVNTASNDGALAAYARNRDIIWGYEWSAARDERVCPICRGLDRQRYKLGSEQRPPAHPNCRCAVLPVLLPETEPEPSARRPDAPRRTLAEWLGEFARSASIVDFMTPSY